jgi:hypothetical protein
VVETVAGEVVVRAGIPVARQVFQPLMGALDLLFSAGHPDIKE